MVFGMKMFKKLLFGTAGIPLSTPGRNTLSGVAYVRALGLDCMELEFVRNINISREIAPRVKETSKKNDVVLTCHGQYFINLNSHDKKKKEASVQRILNAARRASECGAVSVTFHAAYYQGDSPEKTYGIVKGSLRRIVKILKDEGVEIWIRPETTGKSSQFGSVSELLKVSQEAEMVMPCIDFAHIHARTGGAYNSYEEFKEILSGVEKYLGREGLNSMHIHMAGINYTEKGERNHLNLKDSDLRYEELIRAWHEYKIRGVVISESPNIEKDALLLQKEYESQKKMFEEYGQDLPEYRKIQKEKGRYAPYRTGGKFRTKR